MKAYKISEKRLKELLKAEMTLDALECAGVDNWNGYGEHWDMYLDMDDYRDNGLEIDLDQLIEDHVYYRLERFEEIDNVPTWNEVIIIEEKIDLALAKWYKVDYYEYQAHTSLGKDGYTVHWIDLDTNKVRSCVINDSTTDELDNMVREVWNNG